MARCQTARRSWLSSGAAPGVVLEGCSFGLAQARLCSPKLCSPKRRLHPFKQGPPCPPMRLAVHACPQLGNLAPAAPSAALCSKQLEGEAEVGKLEALQWVNALLSQDARLLREQEALLLAALCDALSAASGTAVRVRGAGVGVGGWVGMGWQAWRSIFERYAGGMSAASTLPQSAWPRLARGMAESLQ